MINHQLFGFQCGSGEEEVIMKHLLQVVKQFFLFVSVTHVKKTQQELIYFLYKPIMVGKTKRSSRAYRCFTEFIYLKVCFVNFF